MCTESGDFDGVWGPGQRHMCDTLGVDLKAQIGKLNRRSWATVGLRPTVLNTVVAGDGRCRVDA